ncbi:hypothetical protein [Roseibacillus persicicus]|uniref:SLA1 homology domain-containing protein n=1 Tax=Roseibacillus persicicus TaxID=454148 RepID=A0A918WH03_9BACT|nr:hypothetical protein [Roseibacillus persicicus]GHC43394.1 hypothetical protein GCM10007100_05660 [Roseibacillus persicicus]
MKILSFLCCATLGVTSFANAREWTSNDGKKITADLVRTEGDTVVLLMRGKEFKIPLDRLSEADQEYVREESENAEEEASVGALSLFGQELKAGSLNNIETDLSEKTQRSLSDNKLQPTKIKIALSLPADFDPSKPQKVFWPVGGINNEKERLSGNIARISAMSAKALAAGYVVIAADTEHGNPRETTIAIWEGDADFHAEVIEKIAAEWPEFMNWTHACGGFSSGSKGSFFRTAQLLANDLTVSGVFLGGCNQPFADLALEESGARKSAFKKVKAWVSWGDSDNLVNQSQTDTVTSGIKSAGYRQIRDEKFTGGHTINQDEFAKALAWFDEAGE